MKKSFLVLPLVVAISGCNLDVVDEVNANVDVTSTLHSNVTVGEQVQFTASNTGLLIIDSQQGYVMDSEDFWVNVWYPEFTIPSENVDPQLHQSIDRIAQLAQAANDLDFPTTITYEAYDTQWGLEYSPFIESIATALDENTATFFKQTFNSTLEDDIHAGMQAWLDQGINRIVVAGAETDVCVLQTVLGLKKMGFDVYLASDATFSTEIYERPTFKRLQQAGVKLTSSAEIIESLHAADDLIYSPRYAIPQRTALHQADRSQMAMVNFNMDAQSLAKAEHDNKAAIEPRLISMGLEQEFLFNSIPAFHVNDNSAAYTEQYRHNPAMLSYQMIDAVVTDMQSMNKSQAVISGVVSRSARLSNA